MAKKDEEMKDEQPQESPMAKIEAVDPHAGLVKMRKGDQTIHAHPTVVKEHQKNGWNLA